MFGREKGQAKYLQVSFCILFHWSKLTPWGINTPPDPSGEGRVSVGTDVQPWNNCGLFLGKHDGGLALAPRERGDNLWCQETSAGKCAETEHIPPISGFGGRKRLIL